MNEERPNVLLVSIDALKPEFVFQQEELGISLPIITKYFVEDGITASKGMKSVFPTFTYPCHQSMITGVNPAVHGIFNNGIFDPMGEHKGAWHWFANTNVKTLWEAAKENGYLSASVAFPTSVCAKGDYIAPEFWWDGTELESRFIDAVALPQGLILEMEKDIGRYAGGLDLTEQGDQKRFEAALWMLNHKIAPQIDQKPFFLSAYFASFDEMAHCYGVYSKEAAHALEAIDTMLGALIHNAEALTNGNLVVCVVSDHGTLDNQYNIRPNVLLKDAGLIETDADGTIIDWKAWSQRAGGTAEIRCKQLLNESEARTREACLREVLNRLQDDPNSGILEVLDQKQARARGGFPLADYVLVARKGYEIRDDVTGAYCSTKLSQCAQHGYSEEFEEMRASFLITGKGIGKGTDADEVRLIDVAPTLAHIMGFELAEAEGKSILS